MVTIWIMPSVLLIILGLIACFWGYKFFRLSLAIIGGGVGFFLSEYLFDTFAYTVGLQGNENAKFIFVLLFTIGMGALAFAFYLKAVIVITTIGVGFWINSCYRAYSGRTDLKAMIISWVVGLLIGFVIGMAAKSVQRWAIIIFTALAGSQIVGTLSAQYMIINPGVEEFAKQIEAKIFPGTTGSPQIFLAGALMIMLFTAGVIVQSRGKK